MSEAKTTADPFGESSGSAGCGFDDLVSAVPPEAIDELAKLLVLVHGFDGRSAEGKRAKRHYRKCVTKILRRYME